MKGASAQPTSCSASVPTQRRGVRFAACGSGAVAFTHWARLVIVALVAVVSLVWSRDAHAYAWMIQKGFAECGSCHVDPSGGELLTHMGRVQSETTMSTYWHEGEPRVSDQAKLAFFADEPDMLRLGGSFRYMGIYTMHPPEAVAAAEEAGDPLDPLNHFPMQADVYGALDLGKVQVAASFGVGRVTSNTSHFRAAQVTSADTVGDLALISRWHWLGIELSDDMLMRVGRMNLPFGIRTSEHVLMARVATNTDRESDQQHGVSFAQSTGPWRYELMFSLGNFQIAPDDYRERGYSGTFEYLVDQDLALGMSSSILTSGRSIVTGSQERTIRHGHGVTARWVPFHPTTLLVEADVIKRTGSTLGYTGFVTADVEAFQGLHLAATAEWMSEGKPEGGVAAKGAGQPRLGYWLTAHWLLYTHLDLRADLRIQDDANTAILAQLHLYL